MNRSRLYPVPTLILVSLSFAGCQGFFGSEEDTSESSPTPVSTGDDLVRVDLTAGPVFQTFADRQTVTISDQYASDEWDFRLEGPYLNLNGGESGPGEAWGFGPVGTGVEDYEALTSHLDVTIQFEWADSFESEISDWYLYVDPGHNVYTRYHVYAIDVPSDQVYKLQILGYYADVDGSLVSAMITVRWSPIDSETYREEIIDATAGGSRAGENDPDNKYTYFSLTDGAVVDLTDEEAATSTAWDFAFKRYYAKLNGGKSGPKGVGGFDFHASRQETPEEVADYSEEVALADFQAATSAGLEGAVYEYDRIGSAAQASYTKSPDGTVQPSGSVLVMVGANGFDYYKLLVTDLELDNAGQPTAVEYRVAPIQ